MTSPVTRAFYAAIEDERERVETYIVLFLCLSVTAAWVFFLATALL